MVLICRGVEHNDILIPSGRGRNGRSRVCRHSEYVPTLYPHFTSELFRYKPASSPKHIHEDLLRHRLRASHILLEGGRSGLKLMQLEIGLTTPIRVEQTRR